MALSTVPENFRACSWQLRFAHGESTAFRSGRHLRSRTENARGSSRIHGHSTAFRTLIQSLHALRVRGNQCFLLVLQLQTTKQRLGSGRSCRSAASDTSCRLQTIHLSLVVLLLLVKRPQFIADTIELEISKHSGRSTGSITRGGPSQWQR